MTVSSLKTVSTNVASSWIDGAPVVTGGGLHQVVNPANGAPVAEMALATPADVDRAVASARAALRGWATATPVDRAGVLAKLAELVDANAEAIIAEEVSQTGKPVRLAGEFDVPGSIDNISFFSGAARHLEGKATAEYSGDHTSSIRREAVGVVATITPWNYPLQMAVWKVLPALAAGCSVVIKPAELTPLTTLTLARLATEAGLPDGVFNVVTGAGGDVGTTLAGHPDVDVVTFTGSTPVGRKVMAAAAVHGHRTQLELGGKAPFVVFDDADLNAAIQGAVAGSLINYRPGLHGGNARDRGARSVRRLRRRCRGGDEQDGGRRSAGPRHRPGSVDLHGAPRQGRGHGGACTRSGRTRRDRRQRA